MPCPDASFPVPATMRLPRAWQLYSVFPTKGASMETWQATFAMVTWTLVQAPPGSRLTTCSSGHGDSPFSWRTFSFHPPSLPAWYRLSIAAYRNNRRVIKRRPLLKYIRLFTSIQRFYRKVHVIEQVGHSRWDPFVTERQKNETIISSLPGTWKHRLYR